MLCNILKCSVNIHISETLLQQVEFSPRRLEGFGLTDGEAIERLWAYLRGFSSITKEMSASRRIDLLTDALLHLSRKNFSNSGLSRLKLNKKEIIPLDTRHTIAWYK